MKRRIQYRCYQYYIGGNREMKKKLIGMMLVLAMMASLLTACGKSNFKFRQQLNKKGKK